MSTNNGQTSSSDASPAAQARFVSRTMQQSTATPFYPADPFVHHPRNIEDYREGYPRLSAFVNSDLDLMLFRGFGQLHARVLLQKQDEITEIEQQLNELDKIEANAFFLRSRRMDPSIERKKLVADAEQKLLDYNKLLDSYLRHDERPKPREQSIRSVSNWLNGNKPLSEPESTFLSDWDDLLAPKMPDDHGGLHEYLETLNIQMTKNGLFKRGPQKSNDNHIIFTSHVGTASAARILVTFMATITLVGPIAILYALQDTGSRMGVIALFTLLFASALSALTQTRHYEIFSATAAYCAVMVVFVGSLPGGNN